MDENEKQKQRVALFVDAVKNINSGRYDRAAKTANKILGISRDNPLALKIKLTCHIFNGDFTEALQIFERFPEIAKDLEFEHAYCLYRTKKSKEGLEILENIKAPNNSIMELKAQILYRLEYYDLVPECMEHLMRELEDDYENERQVNLAACGTYLTHTNIIKEQDIKEETYEMVYNKALILMKKGKIDDALKMLEKSEKLLRESFEEEGAGEDEIMSEMIYVRALLGYAHQLQGRTKEAQQIYQGICKQKFDDSALLAVVCNNSVVINKEQNIFDSTKKLKTATSDTLVDKLSSYHRKMIAYNNAVFKCYQHKYEASNKLCDNVEKTFPDMIKQTKILRAFNNFKLDPKSNPLDLIDTTSETTEDDLPLKLTCVQLLLTEGNKLEACKVLESLGVYRYKAGILGALITLYLHLGKQNVALAVYKDAVEWYKSNKQSSIEICNLFKQSAEFHMRNNRPEVAADSLEQILVVKPDDMKAYSELILAYSEFNEKKAIEMSSNLNTLAEIYNEVDIENLESIQWLTTKKSVNSITNSASPRANSDSGSIKRKHKKRKGKLPKNYNASIPPDPERWLPKHERTGFRKKRERKMKDIIKGSQGLATGLQSEQYDFSKHVSVEQEGSPGNVTPSPMQRNRAKKAAPKKKSNKRR